MKNSKLARQFTFGSLIWFALPNMAVYLVMSLYTIVDGMFVSRFVGTNGLAAINIAYPLISLMLALGVMLATGGSALVAKLMGEGNLLEARQNLTLLTVVAGILGVIFMLIGIFGIDDLIRMLGASEALFQPAKEYGQIILWLAPVLFFQVIFEMFFVTEGKPTISLVLITLAGITNVALDYLFIAQFGWGIQGAVLATCIGYSIPAFYGLWFFVRNKTGTLHFVKPQYRFSVLKIVSINGSSEMVTNLATAVTTFLFNLMFMKYYGEDGVAAITVALYLQYVFAGIFFGYSLGVSPVISYKFGEQDSQQLKKVVNTSLNFLGILSVMAFGLSLALVDYLLPLMVAKSSPVFALVKENFWLFALLFLFQGFTVLFSAKFTALSDGKTSAIISFCRTFLFLVAAVLLLPEMFGGKALWVALPVAECLGLFVGIYYYRKHQAKFAY